MNIVPVHFILFFCALATLTHASSLVELSATFPVVSGEKRSTITTGRESLMEVARREGFGYEIVANSNRSVDPWSLKSGTKITLPSQVIVPHGSIAGLNINLAELRLFHIIILKGGPYQVSVYPLGIGRAGRETPEGTSYVTIKKQHPEWLVPESLRMQDPGLPQVMPSGPQNPLGDYWLGLSKAGYGLHGTNRPFGVGRRVSNGCMRMYPEDIAVLFDQVEIDTPVRISYQPVKAAIYGDRLLLEVHPDYLGRFGDLFQQALTVISKTRWAGEIDYSRVRAVVSAQNSLPEFIGQRLDK
jgi:L,D-transpeptidase ErfK/SrfK